MARWPGFIGGSNTTQSLILDSERTVNLLVERADSKAAANMGGLFPTPGFQQWNSAGVITDVASRGAVMAGARLFWVVGGGLYEISSTGVPTRRGTVAQDSNPAQLIYNGVIGAQVGICSGGNVYTYDLATNVLSAALLSGGYTHLAYAKAYGLAFNPLTGKVNLSGLNDLSSWSAGDFFRRSDFPDPWQAMWVDPNALIWLIGTETFEVWSYANPSSTQPWAVVQGLCGYYGIAAPFAYWVSRKGMGWLETGSGGGGTVVSTRGGAPTDVSSYAVASAIASYQRTSTVTDAECFVYQDAGHTAPILTFPNANHTWAYDLEGSVWTERGQWNAMKVEYDLWAPRTHVFAFGKHLVGDRTTGTIWEMDTTFTLDVDATPIRRLRRTAAITDELKRHPIDRVALLMDTGVAGQGINPLATMRMSWDGGRTFGNERQASFGRVGEYGQGVYWDRCGIGKYQQPVAEMVWTADAPVRVVDAFLNSAEEMRAA